MKNIIFSIFILFIFFSLNARAEIAYIDINFLINSSDVGKFLNNQIEIKKKEYKNTSGPSWKHIQQGSFRATISHRRKKF